MPDNFCLIYDSIWYKKNGGTHGRTEVLKVSLIINEMESNRLMATVSCNNSTGDSGDSNHLIAKFHFDIFLIIWVILIRDNPYIPLHPAYKEY